jgi:hypothetical protein
MPVRVTEAIRFIYIRSTRSFFRRLAVLSAIDHKTGTIYGILSLSFSVYAANAGHIRSLLGSSFRRTCVILGISHGPDAPACACAHSNGGRPIRNTTVWIKKSPGDVINGPECGVMHLRKGRVQPGWPRVTHEGGHSSSHRIKHETESCIIYKVMLLTISDSKWERKIENSTQNVPF